MTVHAEMAKIVEGLPTKAAKIRALDAALYARADIARFLGIRYQHVRNVLERGAPKAVRSAATAGPDRTRTDDRAEVKIGPGGRIVIPAAFRAAMAAEEGDTLVAAIDDDGVVRLTSGPAALRMAQRVVRGAIPSDISLSDLLIEERRREAAAGDG